MAKRNKTTAKAARQAKQAFKNDKMTHGAQGQADGSHIQTQASLKDREAYEQFKQTFFDELGDRAPAAPAKKYRSKQKSNFLRSRTRQDKLSIP